MVVRHRFRAVCLAEAATDALGLFLVGRPEIPPFGRTGRNVPVLSCRMPLLTDREARICVCCRAAHLGFCWSGEGSLVCLSCCLPLLLSASPAACLSCYLPLLLSASPAACPSCCEPLLLLTPPGSGGIAPPPAFPPAGPPAPRGGCVTRRRRTCRAGRRAESLPGCEWHRVRPARPADRAFRRARGVR